MYKLETLKIERNKENTQIVTIHLNRPKALNAFNTQMALDLIECLALLRKENESLIIILTGSGKKAFCVGADLKERKNMTNREWKEQHIIFEDAYKALRDFAYPVIGVINGYALGGGLELALSCDVRLMNMYTKVGFPEAKVGIIPGVGGTQLLSRSIPIGLAKQMLFTGENVDGENAFRMGLVNQIWEEDQLMDQAFTLAKRMSDNAPLSLKAIKKSVNQGIETDLNTALQIELSNYYDCAFSQDRSEGILAFNEKRKPEWQGQ